MTSVWVFVPRLTVYFPGENFLFPTMKSNGTSAATLVLIPPKPAIARPRIMLNVVTMRIGFFISPPKISNVFLYFLSILLSILTEYLFFLLYLRQQLCQSAVASEPNPVICYQTDEIDSGGENFSELFVVIWVVESY